MKKASPESFFVAYRVVLAASCTQLPSRIKLVLQGHAAEAAAARFIEQPAELGGSLGRAQSQGADVGDAVALRVGVAGVRAVNKVCAETVR